MGDDPQPTTRLRTIGNSEGETVGEMLPRRERELIRQIVVLRGRLAPLEKELEEVRKAMEAIGLQRSYAEELRPFLENPVEPLNILTSNNLLDMPDLLGEPAPTIKQMILGALNNHFPNGGSPSELRDYIRTAYDKEVDRNSIGPQLARLRDDGMVDQLNDGKWKLSKDGRRIMRYGNDLRKDIENAAEQVARKTPTTRLKDMR